MNYDKEDKVANGQGPFMSDESEMRKKRQLNHMSYEEEQVGMWYEEEQVNDEQGPFMIIRGN